MGRFSRLWVGCFLISLGRRVLPASVRSDWDLQFKRKTFDLHDFDTSRLDRSRPHKFPRAALKADGDILGWECEACGEWVREFGPTEPDECPIDWRNANV